MSFIPSFAVISQPTTPQIDNRTPRSPSQPTRRRKRRLRPVSHACIAQPNSANTDVSLQPPTRSERASSPDADKASPPPAPEDPIDATVERLKSVSNTLFEAMFTPLLPLCPLLQRRWVSAGGNYILHPTGRAKAVLHFIGGAFFSAAPHITYETLLQNLCSRGYVIVAAPYNIGFDHLALVGEIVDRWERVESDLAARYGALPVIGLGHSAGCVFHALGSSLFDDAMQKAGNVLVSFSNRPARKAIPEYERVVLPVARAIMDVDGVVPGELREMVRGVGEMVEEAVMRNVLTPTRVRENVVPSVREVGMLGRQIWPILKEVAEGGKEGGLREFYPTAEMVVDAVRGLYAVGETLVVRFEGDGLDDGEVLAEALRERGGTVGVVTLKGGHLTPVVREVPELFGKGGDGFGVLMGAVQEGVNVGWVRELVGLEKVIDEWVEAGIANDRF